MPLRCPIYVSVTRLKYILSNDQKREFILPIQLIKCISETLQILENLPRLQNITVINLSVLLITF